MGIIDRGTRLIVGAAAFVLLAAAVPVHAEFPEKPVTIIVPWSAGSSPDVSIRTLAELASDDLGQRIVVRNVEGGSGSVGTIAAKRAAPDGYTVLNNWVAPQVVTRLVNPDVGYSNEDFEPLFGLVSLPFTLAVKADHPADNVQEFVAWANEQNRPIQVGVCAALSVPRMVMEEFLQTAGVGNYNPIPFNGCMPDNVKGLLDGSLDATTGVLIAEKIFGDEIKSLAVITDERIDIAPHIPTAKEQGVDIGWGRTGMGWAGLAVPAGTPEDRRQKLIEVLGKAWQSDEFRKRMAEQFVPVEYMPGDEFRLLWEQSEEILRPAVDRILREQEEEE